MGASAYEIYCFDKDEKAHFIGILPERRKNPERVTKDSVLNWGLKIIGNNADFNNIYFVQIEMDELQK